MRRRSFLLAAASAALPGQAVENLPGTIVFTQQDGLWTRELPAGKPVRVVAAANVEAPRWSASGQWISYFREGELFVIARAGGKAASLGKVVRGATAPGCQWVPGRDEILVEAAGGVKFYPAADRWTRAARQIPNASLPVLFSKDGRDAVYADAITRARGLGGDPMRMGRLCMIAIDTHDAIRVLFSKYSDRAIACMWSGDGEQILFWMDPDFSASLAADGLDLYRVSAAGGTPQPLGLTSLLYADGISPAPDGMRLAISTGANRAYWQEKRIAIFDFRTGAITYLTEKAVSAVTPSWSPTGDRIAYSAAPSVRGVSGGEAAKRLLDQRLIWLAGGSTPRQLTDDARYRDEKPLWSADGKQILFCRMDAANERTLWLLDVESAKANQVASPLSDTSSKSGEAWFGYYGYIDWSAMFDWHRAA